ncbi:MULTISPECIES: fibronectin type III domain-containing protein [Bacillus cereus group]|uniref:fibronectin type III domain-containing protein n=1 Tax=Bacillus cereus group TaxID=86661 RepID=UPI00123B94EE|nr:fibronectin type III domain-containing protein [Bacillus cereus]KAA6456076.1 hypothetical protein DX930_31250 [Bacillus cereus]KAB2417302.1 fibronectin type III domain-containing protein [Bacillus cereus]KAB2436998.1 fibronectin type III domain-containing protein [Bacillus cereus]KAB2468085.1 fibronectin type III domain-containing protein [Bacillus cereus]
MNLKKCGFLLVFAMMFCFAIPGFVSAEVKEVNILDGKKGYTSLDFDKVFTFKGKELIVSPSMNFTFDIGNKKTPPIYFDLGREADLTAIRITVADGNNVSVYQPEALFTFYDASKKNIGNSYLKMSTGGSSSKGIGANKARYVKFEYTSGYSGSADNTVFSLGVDAIADLENVFNLNAVEGVNDVNFTWNNPNMDGFIGVKIYKEGSLVATVDKNKNSYKVDGLEEDKNYTFKFVSDYAEGESVGVQKSVKTKEKPKEPMPLVKPPDNVFLTPQNGKMVIAWDDVKSPYLEGYNVYVDGKKINDKPLTSSKLIVKDLENDKSYKVQISAVNKEGVEGEKSKVKEDKPSSDALEVSYDVKMPFNPKDVVGVAMAFLLIVGPLILLGLAFKFYKPFITFLYNSIQNKKGRDEK